MTFPGGALHFGLGSKKNLAREESGDAMKVRASVKKICSDCKVFKRNGVVRVTCKIKKHKQKQG